MQHNKPTIAVKDCGSIELARQMGVVDIGEGNKILSFEEKPSEPKSTMVSTLVYFMTHQEIPELKHCLETGKADRAGDFIKYLVENKHVNATEFKEEWFDIGSHEQLKEADSRYSINLR